MSSKTWIIFIVACIVLFGGLVVWSQKDKVDVSTIKTNTIIAASESNGTIADHVYGTATSKVQLVEYGDFQCPGCGAAHSNVKSVTEKYKNQIAFVYRNFPLTNIHPNARAAAAAAEAAGLDSKYWEMHNMLFENQDEWSDASGTERTEIFASYAKAIGLDEAAFTRTLKDRSTDINKKISFDQALGRKIDVQGTPSFYLNGEKLSEDKYASAEALETTIQDALRK